MANAADLFIVAAGKGSRMGGSVPKALVPITDEPNLTTTLKQIGSKFDRVFIVTNEQIQPDWQRYFDSLEPELRENVQNLPISSGLGDGHAVLSALDMPGRHHDDIVICWGDVFIPQQEIVDELMNIPMTGSGIVPVQREDNPYVTLLTDQHMGIMGADFSKYGETHPNGFHDQSIFRFSRSIIHSALKALHNSLWKNGRYMTNGSELSTLFAFHYLYNAGTPAQVYETIYPTLSFNTPDEVAAIQTEINQKWKSRFS